MRDKFQLQRFELTPMQRIKRVVIAVVGGTVLALGIVCIVLPGPAFLAIPAGLAILAIEFAWAKRWLRSARALLPQRSKDDSAPRKKLSMQSVRCSTGFLLRQVRQQIERRKNRPPLRVKTQRHHSLATGQRA